MVCPPLPLPSPPLPSVTPPPPPHAPNLAPTYLVGEGQCTHGASVERAGERHNLGGAVQGGGSIIGVQAGCSVQEGGGRGGRRRLVPRPAPPPANPPSVHPFYSPFLFTLSVHSPCTFAYLRANLMAASLASVPVLA